jgi:hypothetical protein
MIRGHCQLNRGCLPFALARVYNPNMDRFYWQRVLQEAKAGLHAARTRIEVNGRPGTRRFRLLAPVLVLLGLALLVLAPGILIHMRDSPHSGPAQRMGGFMTYEGR